MSSDLPTVDRRRFLTGVTAAGAALGLARQAEAQAPAATPQPAQKGIAPGSSLAAETEFPPEMSDLLIRKSGSDFMVDVLKTLDIDYLASNPGSSFRGLHELLVNYGGNQKPEFLTCTHEEASVAMAHGYAKIAGKPMACMVHGTVGVQHASMAIYNAYADKVPIIILSGNSLDANTRRPGVEWEHSVQDNAVIIRDYSKWDDTPASLQHFAESTVRAYKIATAVPQGPVMITADSDLQEEALHPDEEAKLAIPRLSPDRPPQGDDGSLREAAKLLAAAENPVIVADRYARTDQAMKLLIQLAELVQAPVVDTGNRVNFPNSHPFNHSGRRGALISGADFILALEPVDLWGMTHNLRDVIGRPWRSVTKADAKVVSIGTSNLFLRANYQDFERYNAVDLSITGDPEATMPSFLEAVQREMTDARKMQVAARGQKLVDAYKKMQDGIRQSAASGWDLSPISPARLAMEVWDQIKNDDWSLVGSSGWARQLWKMDKPYSHNGGSGAAGLGYGAPAAVGAALANREHGRLSVNIQPDGDLMYSPGVLWTSAHHQIPMLNLMFNNRGYHQEVMHIQRMANRHNRGADRAWIGTTLRDPPIDFAKLAQSMGLYAEGPITDPKDLQPAIQRALAVVRKGEPALIDVVSQPR